MENQKAIKTQISKLQSMVKLQPHVFARIADYYMSLGKFKHALKILKDGVMELPEYPTGWIVLGNLYLALNQSDEAYEAFTSAILAEPNHLYAHHKCSEITSENNNKKLYYNHLTELGKIDSMDETVKKMHQVEKLRHIAVENGLTTEKEADQMMSGVLRKLLIKNDCLPSELMRVKNIGPEADIRGIKSKTSPTSDEPLLSEGIPNVIFEHPSESEEEDDLVHVFEKKPKSTSLSDTEETADEAIDDEDEWTTPTPEEDEIDQDKVSWIRSKIDEQGETIPDLPDDDIIHEEENSDMDLKEESVNDFIVEKPLLGSLFSDVIPESEEQTKSAKNDNEVIEFQEDKDDFSNYKEAGESELLSNEETLDPDVEVDQSELKPVDKFEEEVNGIWFDIESIQGEDFSDIPEYPEKEGENEDDEIDELSELSFDTKTVDSGETELTEKVEKDIESAQKSTKFSPLESKADDEFKFDVVSIDDTKNAESEATIEEPFNQIIEKLEPEPVFFNIKAVEQETGEPENIEKRGSDEVKEFSKEDETKTTNEEEILFDPEEEAALEPPVEEWSVESKIEEKYEAEDDFGFSQKLEETISRQIASEIEQEEELMSPSEEKRISKEIETEDDISGKLSRIAKEVTRDDPIGKSESPKDVIKKKSSRIATKTLAELYFTQGELSKAIEIYDELIRIHPNNENYHARRIELLEDLEKKGGLED